MENIDVRVWLTVSVIANVALMFYFIKSKFMFRAELRNAIALWREEEGYQEIDEEVERQKRIWKHEYEKTVRKDAISKHKAVNRGLVVENFAPYLEGFYYNPKDANFFGKPVDFIVFDGLDEGELEEVVFLEIKTGRSQLNRNEKQVKQAIDEGRVRYEVFNPDNES